MTPLPLNRPLERADIAREAFRTAQQITSEWSRSRAVRQMVQVLPPDCLPAALELARALVSPTLRAHTLLAIAQFAPEAAQPTLLAEAAQVIDSMASAAARTEPLSRLAQRLTGDAREAAALAGLACARELTSETERGWLIVGLMPSLPAEARLEALATLRAINEASIRAPTLAQATQHLPEGLREPVAAEALNVARGVADDEARARALAGVLPAVPPAEQAGVADEALQAAAAVGDEAIWGRCVQWVAEALTPDARAAAYAQARRLQAMGTRAETLAALALVAPETERAAWMAEALAAGAQVPDDWGRAFAIEPLAQALPQELQRAALEAARAMQDAWARSDVLAELTDGLPPDVKASVLQEALDAARAAETAWARARALTGVAMKCD
jgi:hypothetical protein